MKEIKEYQLVVKTNSYAGNFEREMCAFLTGQTGAEDDTGHEFVDYEIKERFEEKISGKSDDNGTFRPVSLDDDDTNNFVIHLEEPLSDEDIRLISSRAEEFEKKRPYRYLDKNFKYLGLEQVEIVKTQTKKKL